MAGETTTNSIGIEMVRVDSGTFVMGSSIGPAPEKPARRVTLTRPFYLGTYLVTQAQWSAVMGATPWTARLNDPNINRWRDPALGIPNVATGKDCPTVFVTWNECAEFAGKLSLKESKPYRLPSEAEWEYACRAGTSTVYPFGNDPSPLGEYAWFGGSVKSDDCARPVGGKKANPWGFYDMLGNVLEWCNDWFANGYYVRAPGENPPGPAVGNKKALRGGYWHSSDREARPAARIGNPPEEPTEFIGFRLAMDA